MFKKTNKFRPFYKKFINLRENVQNRRKVFNFEKQKWTRFIEFYKKKLRRYRKFKPQNPNKYVVSKYPNRFTSYGKRYKSNLQHYKIFSSYYGNLLKKNIKRKIHRIKKKNVKNFNLDFIGLFEKRLDVILYRSKFFFSIRSAQQAIVHGNVFVNNKIMRKKSCLLNPGDLISVIPKLLNFVYDNLLTADVWPLPPKYLTINYKTLEIVLGGIRHHNLSTLFSIHMNLEKILTSLPRT